MTVARCADCDCVLHEGEEDRCEGCLPTFLRAELAAALERASHYKDELKAEERCGAERGAALERERDDCRRLLREVMRTLDLGRAPDSDWRRRAERAVR